MPICWRSSLKTLALKLIEAYQATISRATPPSCRFVPSCSHYGYEAIDKFGLFRGGSSLPDASQMQPFVPAGLTSALRLLRQ